jgi:hypothetical protein
MTAIVFTRRSANAKTGPIPVSLTSHESCPSDCPFMGKGCYAEQYPLRGLWEGVTQAGPDSAFKSGRATIPTLSWDGFCAKVSALPNGTFWRHNQAGDLPHEGGRVDGAKLYALTMANVGRRGFTYTHHNVLQSEHNRASIRAANAAGFTVNASANNLRHADQLAALDVAPVVAVLPSTVHGNVKIETPEGRRVVVCPATYRDDVTCQSCKLCAVRDRKVIVGFPAHGGARRKVDAAMAG